MRSSRRSNGSNSSNSSTGLFSPRSTSARPYGRVTKDDIRSAGFRRWNGRSRITTDWVNVFNEPELCYPTGDVVVYLREPGQSSRGPSFRVHKAQLKAKGFDKILARCTERIPLPGTTQCTPVACLGCDVHQAPSELYIPAPQHADLATIFDHHITTRNFFAWLYDIPLAGRALGVSLVALKERIDFYRPGSEGRTPLEVVAFAESQHYLDFRECVDHALAALYLAEHLNIDDLWIDAFTHCVGLSHRGLRSSREYRVLSVESRALITRARLDMDARLDRANGAIEHFFESHLAGHLLGLSSTAKEHMERFRSWLHGFYIKQHGFWPPVGFNNDTVRRSICTAMYTDFRNLYHHLVNIQSSVRAADNQLVGSGGVCILQSIQAFNQRHQYDALANPLPLIPVEPSSEARSPSVSRSSSWNPMARRRVEKDARSSLRKQALVKASNRDWAIMDNALVREYSEYELGTTGDESEHVSMVEGRKIRWIAIYAILQTLIAVMQAPKQVRNTDGLSYALCCRLPPLPWHSVAPVARPTTARTSKIEPDTDLLSRAPSAAASASAPQAPTTAVVKRTQSTQSKRQAFPERMSSMASRASSTSRASSLRRLMGRRASSAAKDAPPVPDPSTFAEVHLQGYGKETNETSADTSTPTVSRPGTDADATPRLAAAVGVHPTRDVTPASSTSVSRESSNASTNSTWSKSSAKSAGTSDTDTSTPSSPHSHGKGPAVRHTPSLPVRHSGRQASAGPVSRHRLPPQDLHEVRDEQGHVQTVHLNTSAWDRFLGGEAS